MGSICLNAGKSRTEQKELEVEGEHRKRKGARIYGDLTQVSYHLVKERLMSQPADVTDSQRPPGTPGTADPERLDPCFFAAPNVGDLNLVSISR
jgi:hypothetical protein